MKWTLFILLLAVLKAGDCNKEKAAKIPPCIQEKIDAIQQQPKFNPPATVYRYWYNNKYVYLFSSDCCDQYNYLYDKDCTLICAPSGGLTGKGDGKCPNFKQMASDEKLIWKDSR
jgi:hypothetical protein